MADLRKRGQESGVSGKRWAISLAAVVMSYSLGQPGLDVRGANPVAVLLVLAGAVCFVRWAFWHAGPLTALVVGAGVVFAASRAPAQSEMFSVSTYRNTVATWPYAYVRCYNDAPDDAILRYFESGSPTSYSNVRTVGSAEGKPVDAVFTAGGIGGTWFTAGSYRDLPVAFYVTTGNADSTGTYTVTLNETFIAQYAGGGATKYGSVSVAGSFVLNVSSSTGSTTVLPGSPVKIGEVHFNSVAAVGRVLVTMNQSGPYQIHVGSEVIEMTSVAGSQAEWATSVPSSYAEGTPVEIWKDGALVEAATVIKDLNGGFEVTFAIILPDPEPAGPETPDDPEPPPDIEDPAESPDTPAGPTAPGDYGGRPPQNAGGPTGDGPPAANDGTPNSTVGDMYRAVRQGVADALNQDAPDDGGLMPTKQESDVASKIDAQQGQALELGKGVNPFAGVSAWGGGGGGAINVEVLGTAWTFTPPAWAGAFRAIFYVVMAFGILITLTQMAKKALAN